MSEAYLSIIGHSFLNPIVLLWKKLEERQPVPPNDVQTNQVENGLSVAIILLTFAMVESFLSRTRHVMSGRKTYDFNSGKSRHIVDFFKEKFQDSGLLDKLIELNAIRDVIMHNHVWDAYINETEKGLTHALPPVLNNRLYGGKRFKTIFVKKTLTSRTLELNLFPTKIWREDARRVLKTAYEILDYLETQDRNYCVVSWIRVTHKNKYMELPEFINRISGTFKEPIVPMAELAE